jgi:hypothetical protein
MFEEGTNIRLLAVRKYLYGLMIRAEARLSAYPGSWTRNRRLPLSELVLCILGQRGLTTSQELEDFFHRTGKDEEVVSKQDYFERRKRLNYVVFKNMNMRYLRDFYGREGGKKWRGYLVLAIDGSRFEIPNSKSNRAAYGCEKQRNGEMVARAACGVAVDVYNRFILDMTIDRYGTSEIEQAKGQIGAIRAIIGSQRVVLLFDRGYPSVEVMNVLEKEGIKYVIRLNGTAYMRERNAIPGEDGETDIRHSATRLRKVRMKDPAFAEQLGAQGSTRVRIVRNQFGANPGAFVTNLFEPVEAEEIRNLYRLRWKVEQRFHTLKNKMKGEYVSGKNELYVKQDYWASVFVHNMIQDMIRGAEALALRRRAGKKPLKYQMRINENIAIGKFKNRFIRMMLEEDDEKRVVLFDKARDEMAKNVVPVRKMPSTRRRFNRANKYHCNLKPSY